MSTTPPETLMYTCTTNAVQTQDHVVLGCSVSLNDRQQIPNFEIHEYEHWWIVMAMQEWCNFDVLKLDVEVL